MNKKEIKLTGLWSLSETFFGGILHAIKIPFKGIYLSNAAVLIISFLAKYSSGNNSIIKSTIIVNIIKAAGSPHTPVQAYLSVFLQGILGSVFYRNKNINFIKIFIFSMSVAIITGFHKVIVLTILFGESLWISLNELFSHALKTLNINSSEINFSLWIIILYASIHIIFGIISAFIVNNLLGKISKENIPSNLILNKTSDNLKSENKKRSKLKKFILITVSFLIILASYLIGIENDKNIYSVFIILLRAVSIILIWVYLVAPVIQKLILKYYAKNKQTEEYNEIQNVIPELKKIISACWESSKTKTKTGRVYLFLLSLFSVLLFYEE